MTGSAVHQLGLLFAHSRYVRCDRLAAFLPDVKPAWQAADAAHHEMLKAALACGFDPGGEHRHLSTEEWAKARCDVIRRVMSNHVIDAERRAA